VANVFTRVTLEDVLITDELKRRLPTKADYLQEKLALQDLAWQMEDHAEKVFPRLVMLAMEVCAAASAGISLYEPQPNSSGLFRWHYLMGALAKFDGKTTPRDFSPCGICLDQGTPILMERPERFYNWLSDADISLPEVLLVPLYVGKAQPLGTLWIVAQEGQHFDSGHARVMTELAAFAGLALRMLRTEQRLNETLEQQETLTREMSHRVKNLFAVTNGMIALSARAASTPQEMAQILSGRLNALARAHAVVRSNFGDEGHIAKSAELEPLVRTILQPHEDEPNASTSNRLRVNGPQVLLGEQGTNCLALVLHELATNAAKYGALKNANGSVNVNWEVASNYLALTWREQGGPPIENAPTKKGFGSALAHRSCVGQLGGAITYDWQPRGLSIKISIPMERLSS
jgi:two-component sensor histidine kinase